MNMTAENSSNIPPGSRPGFSYQGEDRRKVSDLDKFFNMEYQAKPLYLEPGQTIWSEGIDNMVVATVGSGVVVSICDTELQMGVLGYVLVPDALLEAFPYFDKADPKLLRRAFEPIEESVGHMKRHGAGKNRIRMRLIGGATLPGDTRDAGTKNYVFTREYITRKGLSILNEDLGGQSVRRVHFFPGSGRCVRRMLKRDSDYAMIKDVEQEYQARILSRP